MRKKHQSIRIFQNPILEKTTHVHPITPLVMWAPFSCWLLYRSVFIHEMSVWQIASLGVLGLIVWTLSEYLLHRFVFHFPAKTPLQKRLVFLFHGLHHDDPQDPTRLVMPPVPAVLFATILFYFFRLFLGPVYVEPYFAFFIAGYLCYDYIHYGVHHFNPKSKIGKYLKQYHMLHHFAEHGAKWGVSSPLWDHVFGTVQDLSVRVRRKAT